MTPPSPDYREIRLAMHAAAELWRLRRQSSGLPPVDLVDIKMFASGGCTYSSLWDVTITPPEGDSHSFVVSLTPGASGLLTDGHAFVRAYRLDDSGQPSAHDMSAAAIEASILAARKRRSQRLRKTRSIDRAEDSGKPRPRPRGRPEESPEDRGAAQGVHITDGPDSVA
jgi:hypothetical protein